MKKRAQGGARKGAGRKPMAWQVRRVSLTVRVTPANRIKLEELADAQGLTLSATVEKLIEKS